VDVCLSFSGSFLGINVDTVGDLNFLLKAVSYRERVLQRSLTTRLYNKVEKKREEFFDAWNSCLHHVTGLAIAHIHRVTLEQFALAVQECPVEEDHTLLTKVCVKPVFHSCVSHHSIGNHKLCF
ncbi:unnamed protein product, partial [Coregonus sp. 'balchen']